MTTSSEAVEPLTMPKMIGKEISPDVWVLTEPVLRPDLGDNKFVCLADYHGALALIEVSLRINRKEKAK